MHAGRVYKIEEEKHNLKNQNLACATLQGVEDSSIFDDSLAVE